MILVPWVEIEVDLRSVKHMTKPMGPSDGLGMGIMTGLDDGEAFEVRLGGRSSRLARIK